MRPERFSVLCPCGHSFTRKVQCLTDNAFANVAFSCKKCRRLFHFIGANRLYWPQPQEAAERLAHDDSGELDARPIPSLYRSVYSSAH